MNQHTVRSNGLWSRSSTIGQSSYVIFCVGQDLRKVSAFRAWGANHGIGFKSLKGCYQGQMEDSFIVNQVQFNRVRPWTKGQESILVLGPCNARDLRRATLQYMDGRREDLGHLVPCDRQTAFSRPSWTFDPLSGCYFITEK